MENNELTNAITIKQEDIDRIINAFHKLADVIVETAKAIADVLVKAFKWVWNFVKRNIHTVVCKAMLNGKEFHLSQHAKKARTRKKYRNRAYRRLGHACANAT